MKNNNNSANNQAAPFSTHSTFTNFSFNATNRTINPIIEAGIGIVTINLIAIPINKKI